MAGPRTARGPNEPARRKVRVRLLGGGFARSRGFHRFRWPRAPGLRSSLSPRLRIVWRLFRDHRGKGYACQAARTILNPGFALLMLAKILAFTVPDNAASHWSRIGMQCDPKRDFDHPAVLPIPPHHEFKSFGFVAFAASENGMIAALRRDRTSHNGSVEIKERFGSRRGGGCSIIAASLRVKQQHGFGCVIATDPRKLRLFGE